MKAIIHIEGKGVEVEIPLEMYDEIVELSKPKKFEFNYPKQLAYYISPYHVEEECFCIDSDYLEHGRYRLTQEGADMSLARNKRGNRLEALAEHLGGLREWVEDGDNWSVAKYMDEYSPYSHSYVHSPEKVYMTRECAVEICRMINNNEYEL